MIDIHLAATIAAGILTANVINYFVGLCVNRSASGTRHKDEYGYLEKPPELFR